MNSSTAPLHIGANETVASKVDKLQRFLGERYFHPGGLMYTMCYFKGDERRPFEDRRAFRLGRCPCANDCWPALTTNGSNGLSTPTVGN